MISSSVTKIFSNLTIFHYIKPTVLTQIKVRFKHAILDTAHIEEKLGLPAKPKKPIAPFFRYMIEVRASVVAQNPTLKTIEHVALISKMWKSLDAEKSEKYYKAYQIESTPYQELLDQYNKTISEEDKKTVKEKRKEIQEEIEKRKFIRSQRKKAQALDRPKKPMSVYLKYLDAQADRQPDEKYYDYLRRKSSEWKGLSESEKEMYKPAAGEMQDYVNNLLKWKGKMIKLGNYDVIRSEIPNYINFDDVLKFTKSNQTSVTEGKDH